MLLNLSPPHNSTLPDQAMQLYASLGHFTRTCYGEGALPSPSALAHVSCYDDTKEANSCLQLRLRPPQKAATMTFDRVLIKEELSRGQLVTSFSIFADGKSVFDGSAIGRTLIVLLDENVTASFVELKITGYKAKPSFRLFAIPNPASCEVRSGGGGQSGCALQRNLLIGGFPGSEPTTTEPTVSDCCARCSASPSKCVAFWAVPAKGSSFTCTLLKATGGNSKRVAGAVSGSPRH